MNRGLVNSYRGYDLKWTLLGVQVSWQGEWVETVLDLETAVKDIDEWLDAR